MSTDKLWLILSDDRWAIEGNEPPASHQLEDAPAPEDCDHLV
jgi:hypothetical protein